MPGCGGCSSRSRSSRRAACHGLGRARARRPGRRLPELRRAERLAARPRAAARRHPLQRRLGERRAHAARPAAGCRAIRPTTGPRPTGSCSNGEGTGRARPAHARAGADLGQRRPPPRASRRSHARDYGEFCRTVATRYSGELRAARARREPLPRVTLYTVWNEPNRGQFLQPQGAHGFEAPKVMARLHARLRRRDPRRSRPAARVALGPLASRGGQGGIAPIAFLRALPGRRRPAARGRRAQSVPRQPPARVHAATQQEADGAITRAQPRSPRERAGGGLRRAHPDLADRVRLAHRAAAGHRPDHAAAPGRARRAVGRARPRALPVRRDARVVPAPRRLADQLLAQRPRHARQRQEAGLRDVAAPRPRGRRRDATVSGHARSLDRRRRRRRHPAVAGVRLQPARPAAQRGRAGLLGHRRAAQAPRRPDPEPGRDGQGLRHARARGLRARRRGALAGARRARGRAGGQRRRRS